MLSVYVFKSYFFINSRMLYKSNTKVILYNLNKVDLNHKEGIIKSYLHDKDRYVVKVNENNF